jgi:hypothetical protein
MNFGKSSHSGVSEIDDADALSNGTIFIENYNFRQ